MAPAVPGTIAATKMNSQRRLAAIWHSAGLVLQRVLLSTLPLLFFVLHATGILPLEFVQRIENYLYDVRVERMMPRVVDPRVVIVDIDEASLAAEGQWPWPRQKIAALTNALFDDYGIRALGFDVLFGEPERNAELRLIDELATGPLAGDTERLVATSSSSGRVPPSAPNRGNCRRASCSTTRASMHTTGCGRAVLPPIFPCSSRRRPPPASSTRR